MKYYTLCHFTPSIPSGYRRRKSGAYDRVWKSADGFLFHDTENPITITDIRPALFQLSQLHEVDETTGETSNTAIVVRVDDKTLAATFSMSALPTPRAVQTGGRWQDGHYVHDTYDYLSKHPITGWLIDSVKDNSIPAIEINYADIYEGCETLPKLMGTCPCPMLESGECLDTLLWPKVPKVLHDAALKKSKFLLEPKYLQRVSYRNVKGFEYVSPSYTTSADFSDGNRPWDNHDFSLVESRKSELKERGTRRAVKNTARKLQCANCYFSATRKDHVVDCGEVSRCTGHVSADTAWSALYAWLDNASAFQNIDGFTNVERDYLIKLAGVEVTMRLLYEGRATKTRFGGFKRTYRGWCYSMVAGAGDLSRSREYTSFEELKQALNKHAPLLTDPPTADPLDKKVVLACAILGYDNRLTQQYQGYHPLRMVYLDPANPRTVVAEAASNRYVNIRKYLNVDDRLETFVRHHPNLSYSDLHDYYKRYAPQIFLPVITE